MYFKCVFPSNNFNKTLHCLMPTCNFIDHVFYDTFLIIAMLI